MYAGAAGGLLENAPKPLLQPGWESQALEGSAGHRPSPWPNTMEQISRSNKISKTWLPGCGIPSNPFKSKVWSGTVPPHMSGHLVNVFLPIISKKLALAEQCPNLRALSWLNSYYHRSQKAGSEQAEVNHQDAAGKLALFFTVPTVGLAVLELGVQAHGQTQPCKKTNATRVWPGNPYSFDIWVLIVLHSQRTVSMEYWIYHLVI